MRLFHPFTTGFHRLDRLWIYISHGTGYWGPPKRLGAPSEITHLRLVPGLLKSKVGSNDPQLFLGVPRGLAYRLPLIPRCPLR